MPPSSAVLGILVFSGGLHVLAASSCQAPSTLALNLGPCKILAADITKSDINSWGIRVAVSGTEICVTPSTTVNSTFLTETSICADNQLDMSSVETMQGIKMTTQQCRSRRGGLIDRNAVPAASVDGLAALNPGWAVFNNLTAAASATLQLLDQKVTDTVGLVTEGQQLTNSHLGLASGSTLLRRLKDVGLIGALSWGLNSGSQSTLFPRVGSLVLGGFDKGSLAGPFFDYPIATKPLQSRVCPLQVQVTGLTISGRNSSTKSLVEKSSIWNACIEPYDNLFRMPGYALDSIRSFLKDNTKFSGAPVPPQEYKDTLLNLEPGIVYPKDVDLNATLRFTINNNQIVDIPFYEVQRSLRGLDGNGSVVVDQNYNELEVYGSKAEGDAIVLGKAFLSQLYLYVNYEDMTFHLASQRPEATTPLLASTGDCISSGGGLTPEQKGLIAVGSVLGALLVALAAYVVYKWCIQKKANASHQGVAAPSVTSPTLGGSAPPDLRSLPGAGSQSLRAPSARVNDRTPDMDGPINPYSLIPSEPSVTGDVASSPISPYSRRRDGFKESVV